MGQLIGDTRPRVIATETVIVKDEAMCIERQVIAGQPVPGDLVDAYEAAIGGTKPKAESETVTEESDKGTTRRSRSTKPKAEDTGEVGE